MDKKKFYNVFVLVTMGKLYLGLLMLYYVDDLAWVLLVHCWLVYHQDIDERFIFDQRSKCQYLLKCFDKTPNQKKPLNVWQIE